MKTGRKEKDKTTNSIPTKKQKITKVYKRFDRRDKKMKKKNPKRRACVGKWINSADEES